MLIDASTGDDVVPELATTPGAVASGGKNLYGAPVGILMLRSRFPRVIGDAGNALTWPFPVLYAVVEGTSPGGIVRRLDIEDMLPRFLAAARGLERDGADLITTNCGFLVLMQRELQAGLGVPFLSSSLLQVPWLAAILQARQAVGILTIDRPSLTDAHLRAAGIGPDLQVAIGGLDEHGGYFTEQILGDQLALDVERCRSEHVAAASHLLQEHPDVGAIVLECTNMPPYAPAIRAATGLPVFDVTTLVRWGAAALQLDNSLSQRMNRSGFMSVRS